jgi:hypothetical protein
MIMSLYDAFQELKELVERFEGLIEKGKVATSTRNVDLINDFIDSAEEIYQHANSVLEGSRNILMGSQREDSLFKYADVYYRMLVLVSIPYTVKILESASSILRGKNFEEHANRALLLAEKLRVLVDTLKH